MKHFGLLLSRSRVMRHHQPHPRRARCPFASQVAPNSPPVTSPVDFSVFEPIEIDSNSSDRGSIQSSSTNRRSWRPDHVAESITRLVSASKYEEACNYVRRQLQSGYIPSRPVLLLALQAVSIAGQWQQNLPLLQSVCEKAIYVIEPSLWTLPEILKLADAATGPNNPTGANAAVEKLSSLIKEILSSEDFPGVSDNGTNVLDVALRASAHQFGSRIDVAVRLLDIILDQMSLSSSTSGSTSINLVLPSLTIQLVLRKCLQHRRVDLIDHLFARIESMQIAPTEAMIYVLLRSKILQFDIAAAEQVIRALPGLNFPLHPSFLSSFIIGCILTRNLDAATSVLRFWQQQGGVLDANANDLLLILYYICKKFDVAREIFQRRKFSKLAAEAATARTYNLAFLYEMSSSEPDNMIRLVDEMQILKFQVDPLVVRKLIRKSISDPFETTQSLTEMVDELSQIVLSQSPQSVSSVADNYTPINANYTISKAISDLLPGYGSLGRLLEMAQIWQDRITDPGYYEIARLMEAYILAGKPHDALSTLTKNMLPLLDRDRILPSNEISLGLIAALATVEAVVPSLNDLMSLWKRFTSLPGFKPNSDAYTQLIVSCGRLKGTAAVVLPEVIHGIESAHRGEIFLDSVFCRALMESYIIPLRLEKDQSVQQKWLKLFIHRKIQTGAPTYFAPKWRPPMISSESTVVRQNVSDPIFAAARIRYAAKAQDMEKVPVHLTGAEVEDLLRDARRWINEYTAITTKYCGR